MISRLFRILTYLTAIAVVIFVAIGAGSYTSLIPEQYNPLSGRGKLQVVPAKVERVETPQPTPEITPDTLPHQQDSTILE